jgi:hypothetical protein
MPHRTSLEGEQLATELAIKRFAAFGIREAVYRPRLTVPVSDWVTCVSCDSDSGLLVAGTLEAELLLLGQGGHGTCCFR